MLIREDRDLPERLDLPLATGEPWWYWLGGRPALDLVNTLRERWRREVETLVTPRDLGRWLVRAQIVSSEPQAVDGDDLRRARLLREAIDACVRAAVAGTPIPATAVQLIDGWLEHADVRPRLVVREDGTPLLKAMSATAANGSAATRSALAAVALDAARMLGRPEELGRIRICASETCSARFYDRSPAGRRRWCSMTACGNAAKARRLRARRREARA